MGNQNHDTASREITATRRYDAPRELVWKMWTEAEHVAKWWGPNGFTNTIQEMDVRPGGRWRLVMHGPDGTDYKNESVYVEVVPPELLVFDHVSWPKFTMRATFTEQAGQTEVGVRMLFDTAELRDQVARQRGAVEGLNQGLAKLAEYLTEMAD